MPLPQFFKKAPTPAYNLLSAHTKTAKTFYKYFKKHGSFKEILQEVSPDNPQENLQAQLKKFVEKNNATAKSGSKLDYRVRTAKHAIEILTALKAPDLDKEGAIHSLTISQQNAQTLLTNVCEGRALAGYYKSKLKLTQSGFESALKKTATHICHLNTNNKTVLEDAYLKVHANLSSAHNTAKESYLTTKANRNKAIWLAQGDDDWNRECAASHNRYTSSSDNEDRARDIHDPLFFAAKKAKTLSSSALKICNKLFAILTKFTPVVAIPVDNSSATYARPMQ